MGFVKYILFFGVSICSLLVPANAQELQTTTPERLSNEITHFDILGKVNGNILLFKYGRNYFEVNAFDSEDLDLSFSKEIRFKHKRANMLELILTNNGALAFYSVRQNGEHNLMVQPLDQQFKLKGEPLIVNKTDKKNIIYRITHSANRNFYAAEIINRVGTINQEIEVFVLDKNLTKIGNITIQNENGWRFKESLLGLNGELFLVSDRKQTGLFADESLIRSIKINALINGVAEENVLNEQNRLFTDFKSKLDLVNSELIIAGIFNKSTNDTPDGYFYTRLAYADSLAFNTKRAITFEEFPQNFRFQTTRKTLLGQRNRLDELVIREIVPRSDGGAILIGELYNEITSNNIATPNIQTDLFAGRPMQTESFNYDDMVALCIAPNGDLEWTEVLRKAQYSEDDSGHFSSFGIMNFKNSIELLFNEEIEYITPVRSFQLSKGGSADINTLFSSDKYDILMSPRHAKQVAKNEIVIPAYTNRNYFVLVQLVY